MAEVRVVVDTNAWISYAFFRQRQSNLVKVIQGFLTGEWICLASGETLSELHEVVSRPGWERYTILAGRLAFARRVGELCETTQVETALAVCRDAKDDKFLALAIDGQADFLVTGDKDLLALA
ncbi:MAG TPA: putative toxin-antitoxin system toxin component, PIN family [Alphaproteobacteria bacterium]|jgi:putative PIN family toxin of toxin-antitoxin system|nr:putative toxin-antitoxin system toxin component, PIN family [Alphaproteobacteria bacterium]HJM50673.1 putative toxin-antitoxin system toxin component, PIN family [Alphaproteobacteria bacterium]|tara:strand:- start:113 stop:481 length:369 start_codon:yes stop_codon:yes gene_type:complete